MIFGFLESGNSGEVKRAKKIDFHLCTDIFFEKTWSFSDYSRTSI
jgi:hypothetical protein